MSTTHHSDHHRIYEEAEAYDIAFDFRDLDRECDALDAICLRHRGNKPVSFADIACGPGYHGIRYAQRGLWCCGVDINPVMLRYATGKAARAGATVEFIEGDMRDFTLPRPVDLAFCAMASFHYLLTTDDIIRHLRSVARNLTPQGLYVIEANHPRDLFGVGKSAQNEWEIARDDVVVQSCWGLDDISFDPLTQIAHSTVRMTIKRGHEIRRMEFVNVDRALTYQEFQLLIEKCGAFDIAAWLGTLDANQPFDNTKESWRMIPVLRKRSEP